jgi:hypothetical protein
MAIYEGRRLNSLWMLRRGELPLEKAFWAYAVGGYAAIFLGAALVTYAFGAIVLFGALGGGSLPSNAQFLVIFTVVLALQIVASGVFIFFVPIGVWRSASRDEGGRPIWRALAKTFVVALAVLLACNVVTAVTAARNAFEGAGGASTDPKRTSRTAGKSLKPNPEYPYTGFWQAGVCDPDNIGITLEGAKRWGKPTYRVDFCGLYGCQFRSYNSVVHDPEFKIIDKNTLEFEGAETVNKTYRQCG